MSVELLAEVERVPGAPDVQDGWRGLLDLGEKWSNADKQLWKDEWGQMPVGEPLTYGCELSRESPESRRVTLSLFALEAPRDVMTRGQPFTLRDGGSARATGTLL